MLWTMGAAAAYPIPDNIPPIYVVNAIYILRYAWWVLATSARTSYRFGRC